MSNEVVKTIDKFYTLSQLKEMDEAYEESTEISFKNYLSSQAGEYTLNAIIGAVAMATHSLIGASIAANYSFTKFLVDYKEQEVNTQVKHAIGLLEETNPTNGAVRFRTEITRTNTSSRPYRVGNASVTYNSNY